MYYVYILYSARVDRYYVGYTKDLTQRLEEHNSAQGRRYTRNKGPWKIVYDEIFAEDLLARKREIAIKRKKRRSYLEWLIANENKEDSQ